MQEYENILLDECYLPFLEYLKGKKKHKKENFCLYPVVSFEESLQEVSYFKNSDIF